MSPEAGLIVAVCGVTPLPLEHAFSKTNPQHINKLKQSLIFIVSSPKDMNFPQFAISEYTTPVHVTPVGSKSSGKFVNL